MIKRIKIFSFLIFLTLTASGQKINFTEYQLNNGLHVILHQDNSAPVITVGVMYHIGAKDEEMGRTGFAHFFEHLLFEGTENIERGEFPKLVAANGGNNNANTTEDRTYYYATYPSNKLELALWMEAERMAHPVINQIGVDTQNEVIKEEKRTRIDNAPYGKIIYATGIHPHLFSKHPYKNPVIGTTEDLDSAKLNEFIDFFKRYYIPNNATLVITGDFQIEGTKSIIEKYFGTIPKGKDIKRNLIVEPPFTKEKHITENDPNIQIPLKLFAYQIPSLKHEDVFVLKMISTMLTDGKSSRLYKRMVEEEKQALEVLAFPRLMEDYGTFVIGALPMGGTPLTKLETTMDEEIEKLKNQLISESEFQKLQNKFQTNFVLANMSVEGIAHSLATYQMLHGNTNLINTEIEIYQKITREDIMRVAKKYLNNHQRLNLDYLPLAQK